MAQKILVCDDSRTIQQAVAVALFEMKTEIVTVSDPAQVVSSALAESPKLILLDNRMNRESRDDGYALCQQIKNHDDLKHIPVIFLAGRSYEPQKGRDAGAFDFIEKPFETQMLADKVQAGLSASPGEVVRPKMPVSSGPSDFRATTALPTFSPVDLQNMLPPDASARAIPPPLANIAALAHLLPPSLSFLMTKKIFLPLLLPLSLFLMTKKISRRLAPPLLFTLATTKKKFSHRPPLSPLPMTKTLCRLLLPLALINPQHPPLPPSAFTSPPPLLCRSTTPLTTKTISRPMKPPPPTLRLCQASRPPFRVPRTQTNPCHPRAHRFPQRIPCARTLPPHRRTTPSPRV